MSNQNEKPNENCLEGMKCPKCGSYGPYRIMATQEGMVQVSDDGTDDLEGPIEWVDGSKCECAECGHEATVAAFRGEEIEPESEEESVFILIQEGGSSYEQYVHAWGTEEEAEQDRIDCARDGAYRTSPVMEIPASLARHPEFYTVAEALLQLSKGLECVEYDEESDGEEEGEAA